MFKELRWDSWDNALSPIVNLVWILLVTSLLNWVHAILVMSQCHFIIREWVVFVTHYYTFVELELWVEDKISKLKSCFQLTIVYNSFDSHRAIYLIGNPTWHEKIMILIQQSRKIRKTYTHILVIFLYNIKISR